MHLVDAAGLQVLPDRGDAAAEADVAAARRLARALERGLDAVGDEMEGRAARHRERRARVMASARRPARGRAGCRPTSPSSCRPARGRAPGPNMLRPRIHAPMLSKPRAAKSSSMPGLRRRPCRTSSGRCGWRRTTACSAEAADAERVLQALVRAGAVAVEGDGEAVDAELAHGWDLSDCLRMPLCQAAAPPGQGRRRSFAAADPRDEGSPPRAWRSETGKALDIASRAGDVHAPIPGCRQTGIPAFTGQ